MSGGIGDDGSAVGDGGGSEGGGSEGGGIGDDGGAEGDGGGGAGGGSGDVNGVGDKGNAVAPTHCTQKASHVNRRTLFIADVRSFSRGFPSRSPLNSVTELFLWQANEGGEIGAH